MVAAMWSKKSLKLFRLLLKIPFLGKLVQPYEEKIEAFQKESHKIKKILPKLVIYSLPPFLLKGLEWYFLGLAVGLVVFFLSWLYWRKR